MEKNIESCPDLWSLEDYDIFLLPSITLSFYETRKLSSIHEERHLVMLNLLKNKNSRIIVVTSNPLEADILKYRLKVFSQSYHDPNASERVILISANDDSCRPLTDKILEKEEVMEEIRKNIRNMDKSIMLSYICTEKDLQLRNKLGIPKWFGSNSSQWGTKSGSRQVFKESGVPIAHGLMKPVYSIETVEEEVLELARKGHTKRIIAKMDDGSGGNGNLVLDFSKYDLGKLTLGDVKKVMRAAIQQEDSIEKFSEVTKQSGMIIEAMVDPPGANLLQTTPSVQLFVSDVDKVQILSSHEQVMDGCVYLGCRYPAYSKYADTITQHSFNVGKTLAKKGVRGFLGVDFLATQKNQDDWEIIALEINIRLCATTFAFFLYITAVEEKEIRKKQYLMLDEVKMRKDLTKSKLPDELQQSKLGFDLKAKKGVLFATLGRLDDHHEASPMIIGDTKEEVNCMLTNFLEKFGCKEQLHGFTVSPAGVVQKNTAKTVCEASKGSEKLNEQGEVVSV